MVHTLLGLPSELTLLIISHVRSPGTRASLAQTCRQLRDLTEEPLYSNVVLWSEAKYNAYFRAVMVRKERLNLIKHYELHYPFAQDGGEPSRALWMSAYMPGLESLIVKCPDTGNDNTSLVSFGKPALQDVQRLFQEQQYATSSGYSSNDPDHGRGPLASLRSCELDFGYASRRFDLLNFAMLDAVFNHQTLLHLSIKNVDITLTDRIQVRFPASNSIRNLDLVACEIVCTTFEKVLNAHVALRRLSLVTTRYIWDGWDDDFPYTPFKGKARWVDIIRAISLAGRASSLEHLELTSFNKHTIIPVLEKPLDLSSFGALQMLILDGATSIAPKPFVRAFSRPATMRTNSFGEVAAARYQRMVDSETATSA